MIRPGQTVFTRMLSLPRSAASVFMRPATPGRTAFESRRPGIGCFTDDDWIVMMRPHLRFRIDGSVARIRRTTDRSESSKACTHCSSLSPSKSPRGGPPALATRMSIPPRASVTPRTSSATSAGRVTSQGIANTSALVRARISSAAALRSPSDRAQIPTRAPSAASPSAHARPMPLLAAVTSATLPLSPRSIASPSAYLVTPKEPPRPRRPRLELAAEIGAVTARHLETSRLVVAHHLERDAVAGAAAPEREVEVPPRLHLLRVEREDQVTVLEPGLRRRPVRHEPRDDHALFQRMGEHAEPRPPRPAHDPTVAQELLPVAQVALRRDREGGAADLGQVQRNDADHPPGRREERAAAVARVRRVRHEAALEQVLPVRLELAHVRHEPVGDAPLLRARSAEREDGVATLERPRVADLDGGETLALDPQQRQADLEVLSDQLRPRLATGRERHLDGLAPHHDVVHGEDEPSRIDDGAGPHPLEAQDRGRGVGGGDLCVDVHHGRQQVLDQLDGRIHRHPRIHELPQRRGASGIHPAWTRRSAPSSTRTTSDGGVSRRAW